ncbi:MAG: O-antigen ligase family protein [Candidatus Daviesbacteria bacterium]|nr:MAG: O-antigen ligase family protein [Candidatus Daviesbacteria bacterium]
MIFVYLITIVITTAWVLKMISQKKLLLKNTPLNIPLLAFLGANILSTIFSIDLYTSVFGYYSRSNGGLLSILSYFLLYFALVSNFTKADVPKFLKAGLAGGLAVSLWAIPEHFGVSPSCIILHGQFNASCWVQDVEARVFATLGQPNWLASYLSMLIFPALYFLLTAKNKKARITYYISVMIMYLAFTFTYSRGATLGFLIGLAVFFAPLILAFHPKGGGGKLITIKPLLIVLLVFLLINLVFGSAITRFQLSQFLSPTTTPTTTQANSSAQLTQLENGGTESGKIRLIVWQGAVDIFKHYPLFGSGVETFAYIYYQFRPPAHNLVSEWDFLYNKAHNEYLNYLATTGLVGFLTYSTVVLTFIAWSLSKILNLKLKIENSKTHTEEKLLIIAITASYTSYLVQNLVGFSVVVIALFFYLFPALAILAVEDLKFSKLPRFLQIALLKQFLTPIKLGLTSKIASPLLILISIFLFFTVLKYWYTDTLFAQGEKFTDLGEITQAYTTISEAAILNPLEPFFRSELGYAAAAVAVGLKDTDATLSGQLKNQAVTTTETILREHPRNVSFYRTAIRTFYLLSTFDPTFTNQALTALDQTIKLSPSDPKLLYNKAIILGQDDKQEEAIKNLQQAIQLKNNYREAYVALGLFYFDQKNYPAAVENMNKVLRLVPNDPEALSYLNDWGKKGIVPESK